MGNCLAQQEKLIQVEYKPPLKVHQVLSEYGGHAVSQTLMVIQHLRPDKEYHNIKEAAGTEDSGVLRIKLVIRRQDLEMSSKGGVLVGDMISKLRNLNLVDSLQKLDDDSNRNCKRWKPTLQSILEAC